MGVLLGQTNLLAGLQCCLNELLCGGRKGDQVEIIQDVRGMKGLISVDFFIMLLMELSGPLD